MITKQKIKYIPNNKIKKRVASSNSPSVKYVQIKKSLKETSKHKYNSLNKSRERSINRQFPHTGLNSLLNLSHISSIPNNKMVIKKNNCDNSLNSSSNFINSSFSMQNSMMINNKNKNSTNKNNKISNNIVMMKNTSIHKPKKILNLNTDFNISRNSCDNNYIITDDYNIKNNNKEILRNNFLLKNNSNNYIINNNNNIEILPKNNNEHKKFISTVDDSIINIINENQSTNKFSELEEKLKIKLSENKLNNRIITYNTYKNIFEEAIKILPENQQNLFNIILNGYQNIITGYSNDEKNINEQNENYKNIIKTLEKENIENKKKLQNKETEINEWKKKIRFFLEKSPEQISKSTNASVIITSSDKEKEKENEKIKERNSINEERKRYIEGLNKKNIKDLDALYFYDKVCMRCHSKSPLKNNKGEIIPILDFNFEKKRTKSKMKNNYKNDNNSFIQKVAMSFNLK